MITKKLSEAPLMKADHGLDTRALYKSEKAVVAVLTLEEGQSLDRHTPPVDVAFFVLSGTGTIEIGDEKAEVTKDTLIESPKDVIHAIHNEGSDPLRILVLKML